jgi:hypothetical protein
MSRASNELVLLPHLNLLQKCQLSSSPQAPQQALEQEQERQREQEREQEQQRQREQEREQEHEQLLRK